MNEQKKSVKNNISYDFGQHSGLFASVNFNISV